MTESSSILLITGPPGSGKTTVARLLSVEFERSVHLESDLFFEFIASGFVEPWRPESLEQNEVIMQIVCDAAASYAAAGYFTIVDGILIPGWHFETVRDGLHRRGMSVAYVVLRPELTTAIARADARIPRKLSDAAVIEQLWTSFGSLGALERHVVENDSATPEQTAALVLDYVRQGNLQTRPP